jgi:ubiquinone biosynthesis UbiH/UbiF/VisC/COQ6 family hydroxylase
MQLQSDICIIGNGAIGKTAALGFAQAGHGVTLLAPATAKAGTAVPPGWDVRVYALNHTAHDLLASLRVWNALDMARVAPVDAMEVKGDGAKDAGRLVFDAYGARTGALAWIVEDANLNQALDAALRFAPNVKIVRGRATSLRADNDAARVVLDNGDILEASLLVGADGGQSWVRGQCDIAIDYRPYHQRAVVANFECEKPHHGVAHQWFAAHEGIIALLPLPGQRLSLVWSASDALAAILMQESQEQLAQRLAPYANEALGALRPIEPEAVKAFPLSLIRPKAITAPRVALIGDAAHVVHPLAGHGMNLGFGDVADLLKAVAEREPPRGDARRSDARRDCGDSRILGRYVRARKEDILLMHLATDGLERLFAAEFEPVRLLRNAGLNLVNKLPVLKSRLVAHALGKRA